VPVGKGGNPPAVSFLDLNRLSVGQRAERIAPLQQVGLPAERALNLYVQAGNTWNNCIGNLDCSLDDIEPQLQRRWAAASRKLADAEQGLEDLGEP
jgi:hypothetical protein